MALFLDAGQVAPRAADFDSGSFKKTYGIGLTLHTLTTAVTRIDLARTPAGNSIVFSVEPELLKYHEHLRQPSTHEDPSMTPLQCESPLPRWLRQCAHALRDRDRGDLEVLR